MGRTPRVAGPSPVRDTPGEHRMVRTAVLAAALVLVGCTVNPGDEPNVPSTAANTAPTVDPADVTAIEAGPSTPTVDLNDVLLADVAAPGVDFKFATPSVTETAFLDQASMSGWGDNGEQRLADAATTCLDIATGMEPDAIALRVAGAFGVDERAVPAVYAAILTLCPDAPDMTPSTPPITGTVPLT